MGHASKRKAENNLDGADKRNKKQWRVPRKTDNGGISARAIQPGDSGIWVTCVKGKEGKCVGEVRDLFNEYATSLYRPEEGSQGKGGAAAQDDIEDEIHAEIEDLKKPLEAELFTPLRLDVQCVLFFRVIDPVEPVALVKKICEDAMTGNTRQHTRFAKRLSPMSLMGRASAEGLEKVATEVLRPHFHQEPFRERKYAIRPNIRNHNILKRDAVIKQVASLVGPGHQVDLKDYDLLIVVEVYQNVCGMSVLDNSFDRLKRYNLSEIYEPTVLPATNTDVDGGTTDEQADGVAPPQQS